MQLMTKLNEVRSKNDTLKEQYRKHQTDFREQIRKKIQYGDMFQVQDKQNKGKRDPYK